MAAQVAFVAGSSADNAVESQAWLTVASASSGTAPSWLAAPVFARSSCCTPDSSSSSCCTRCKRTDRRETASKSDSCSDVAAPAGAAGNSHTCADCNRAPLASQTPSPADGTAAGSSRTHPSPHSPVHARPSRTAFDSAVECWD